MSDNKPLLQVKALGQDPEVILFDDNDSPGKRVHWKGTLPRDLFLFFMERLAAGVTRDDIFATFWPGLSIKDATNVYHVSKRKINEILQEIAGLSKKQELHVYRSGYYLLSGVYNISYDVHIFEAHADALLSSLKPVSLQDWQVVAVMYEGDYLPGMHRSWIIQRRKQLKLLAADVCWKTANTAVAEYRFEMALRYLRKAQALNPIREDIVYLAMQILSQTSRMEEAIQVYQDFETKLKAQLNIEPDLRLRVLYRQISEA